jgi:hypothetical protein
VKRFALGALALGGLGLAAWQAYALGSQQVEAVVPDEETTVAPAPAGPSESGDNATEAVSKPMPPPERPLVTAETPLAERVAVLGLLNKRSGESRDLTLRPGQADVRDERAVGRSEADRCVRPGRCAEPRRQLASALFRLAIQGIAFA